MPSSAGLNAPKSMYPSLSVSHCALEITESGAGIRFVSEYFSTPARRDWIGIGVIDADAENGAKVPFSIDRWGWLEGENGGLLIARSSVLIRGWNPTCGVPIEIGERVGQAFWNSRIGLAIRVSRDDSLLLTRNNDRKSDACGNVRAASVAVIKLIDILLNRGAIANLQSRGGLVPNRGRSWLRSLGRR